MRITAKVAFWWIVLFNIVDVVLTALILRAGGSEANPIMLLYINAFGLMGLVYGKIPALLGLAVVVYGLWDRLSAQVQLWTHRALILITVLMSALTVYSSVVLYNTVG